MKQYLIRHWWKYLIVILLPVIVWCTVFSARSKPKRTEVLRVLYVGEGLNTQSLQADLTALLPQMKEITVTQEPMQAQIGGDWLTYRQFAYDILIFSEPYCTEDMGQKYFSRFSEYLTSQFPTVPKYTETVNDIPLTYALRLIPNETRFADYCDTEEPGLMFFSPESANLGGKDGQGTDNAAIIAAQYLSEAIH